MWRRIKAGVFLIVATAIVLFAVSIVIQTDDLNMLSDAFPDFGETTMMRALGLAAGGLLVLITAVGPSTAAEQQFSCKGQVIRDGQRPSRRNQSISA
jgi:hypothetical protein